MRPKAPTTVIAVALAVFAFAASANAAGTGSSGGNAPEIAPGVRLGPSGAAFYNPPSPLPKGKPGDLIWAVRIGAPKGAQAWKILYRSTLSTGKPVAVSGFVVVPKRRPPAGGWPVVAWAHGTEGGGRNCAPSLAPDPARELIDFFTYESPYQQDVGVPALLEFLKAGYAVVATDYQGLGTPGVEQYVVMGTESRNVFDSVRAARDLKPVNAGNRVVVLGWSQGGGVGLWMGQTASSEAGLQLLGVAALAPAANTGPQAAGQVPAGAPPTPTSPAHAVAIELNLYRGYSNAYPELKLDGVLTEPGLNVYRGAGIQCINHFAYVINTNVSDLKALFQPSIPADWQRRFNENTPGYVASVAPVLVMQGTADTVINPNGTAQYVQRACTFDQPVQYSTYEGATHQTIPYAAKAEYVGWIADRFAGRPAPSNC